MNEILIENVYWEQSEEFRNEYSLAEFMLCFYVFVYTVDVFLRVLKKTKKQ